MKTFIKVVKYLFFGLVGLVIFGSIGLLFYYQSIYKETPFPVVESVKRILNNDLLAVSQPVLLPIPKKTEWKNGHFNLNKTIGINAPADDVEAIKRICINRLNCEVIVNSPGNFKFIKNRKHDPQAYQLSIEPKQIIIEYSDLQGLFFCYFNFFKLLFTKYSSELIIIFSDFL